jgi:transcriptional regulator with XRE-family HTH domain
MSSPQQRRAEKAAIRNTKKQLLNRGWTAVELANRAGVDPADVSHFLSGKKPPSLQRVSRLARAFAMETWELYK